MNYRGNERRSSYVAFLKPLLGAPNLRVETGGRTRDLIYVDDAVRATPAALTPVPSLTDVSAARLAALQEIGRRKGYYKRPSGAVDALTLALQL